MGGGYRVKGLVCGYFFFQAEDGIRDGRVTGVQTCALPISSESKWRAMSQLYLADAFYRQEYYTQAIQTWTDMQTKYPKSEQIGRASCRKECRARWSPNQHKKKKSNRRVSYYQAHCQRLRRK